MPVTPTQVQPTATTPKCEHCSKALAFATFKVEDKQFGMKLMALCADCGFNLPNLSVSRLAQIPSTDWRGRTFISEVMYRYQPYKSCRLVEVFESTLGLMQAYRDAENREMQAKIKVMRAPKASSLILRVATKVTPRVRAPVT